MLVGCLISCQRPAGSVRTLPGAVPRLHLAWWTDALRSLGQWTERWSSMHSTAVQPHIWPTLRVSQCLCAQFVAQYHHQYLSFHAVLQAFRPLNVHQHTMGPRLALASLKKAAYIIRSKHLKHVLCTLLLFMQTRMHPHGTTTWTGRSTCVTQAHAALTSPLPMASAMLCETMASWQH